MYIRYSSRSVEQSREQRFQRLLPQFELLQFPRHRIPGLLANQGGRALDVRYARLGIRKWNRCVPFAGLGLRPESANNRPIPQSP
jgi:hypothetical protein